MDGLGDLKAVIGLLLSKLLEAKQALADALNKPPVGQEELDAANAETAKYKALVDQYEAEEAGIIAHVKEVIGEELAAPVEEVPVEKVPVEEVPVE
jgi:hypothetical protein